MLCMHYMRMVEYIYTTQNVEQTATTDSISFSFIERESNTVSILFIGSDSREMWCWYWATARDNKTYVWSIAIIDYNNQLSKPIYVNYFELT